MLAQENHHRHLLRNSYITRRPKHFQPLFLTLMLCWFEHLPAWVSATEGKASESSAPPTAWLEPDEDSSLSTPYLGDLQRLLTLCLLHDVVDNHLCYPPSHLFLSLQNTAQNTDSFRFLKEKHKVLSAQPWSQGNVHNSITCVNISSLDGNAPAFQVQC